MKSKDKQKQNFDNVKNIRDFVPHEVRYKSTLYWSRVLMLSIVGSVGFGIFYACVSRIDEVVIAKGELQAFGGERPIKTTVSGVVREISVQEGDPVKAGQILLKLDTKVFEAKQESLNAKLKSLRMTYELENQIEKKMRSLSEQGAIQVVEYLRQKNKLQVLSSEIIQTESLHKELKYQSNNYVLKSPVKGRVFALVPSSSGYAATIGETLLKIVPDGDVEAKIFIANSDIGFAKLNMKSEVRVDAYPFTQFGSIEGKLTSIAEEVIPADNQYSYSRFPAYVKLSKQFLVRKGQHYKVRSGQSVSVNLLVRRKPVISLLTDALEKSLDSLRGIKSEMN